MNRIYPQQWIHLTKDVRNQLVQVFGIPRTGVTEVKDDQVVSDGHTMDDLGVITLEAMCEYIGSEETFARAWEITLSKVHAELNPPVAIIQNVNGEATMIDVNSEFVVKEYVDPKAFEKVAFCDSCDSKGVRHKKDCPKAKK